MSTVFSVMVAHFGGVGLQYVRVLELKLAKGCSSLGQLSDEWGLFQSFVDGQWSLAAVTRTRVG